MTVFIFYLQADDIAILL